MISRWRASVWADADGAHCAVRLSLYPSRLSCPSIIPQTEVAAVALSLALVLVPRAACAQSHSGQMMRDADLIGAR